MAPPGVTKGLEGRDASLALISPTGLTRPREVVREVKFPSSGLTEKVEGRLSCKQGGKGGFLYVVQETKSGGSYIGESGQLHPATRAGQHRRAIEDEDEAKAVGRYFLENRATTESLRFIPFIAVKSRNPYVRKFLERKLIIKHRLVESPLGMNVNI